MKQLGTCPQGYAYVLHDDLYVYQYRPDGSCVGWLCSWPAWEQTFSKIVEEGRRRVSR